MDENHTYKQEQEQIAAPARRLAIMLLELAARRISA
jgi:hypothetical protein